MTKSIDWKILDGLRVRFLDKSTESKAHDYWDSAEILDLYDRTFAQRIRWKWQAVLDELRRKQGLELPRHPKILDWGCGTGIAARTFLNYADTLGITEPEILLFDRSNNALNFARNKLAQEFSGIKTHAWTASQEKPDILLLSHVLNEINDAQLLQLKHLVLKSALTIWVEPGTYNISRKLLECREFFKDRLHILAPCPQGESCPLSQEKNMQDWCHQFAPPPAEVFQSAFWARFSKQLKIDLRSLPVSFLVLSQGNADLAKIPNRMIGKAKKYKPYQSVMICTQTGLLETVKITKRTNQDLYKSLDDPDFCTSLEPDAY
jgi:ribosomal protein RSM22 (predicted rRNA methylase)